MSVITTPDVRDEILDSIDRLVDLFAASTEDASWNSIRSEAARLRELCLEELRNGD